MFKKYYYIFLFLHMQCKLITFCSTKLFQLTIFCATHLFQGQFIFIQIILKYTSFLYTNINMCILYKNLITATALGHYPIFLAPFIYYLNGTQVK